MRRAALIGASIGLCSLTVLTVIEWYKSQRKMKVDEENVNRLLIEEDQQFILDTEDTDQLVKNESPPNLVSSGSYTSCEEDLPQTSGSHSSYSSISSSVSDLDNPVEGAIGLSTYERYAGKALSETQFQDLLSSPVVKQASETEDIRMDRHTVQERSLHEQNDTVQQYDSELSPSRVDEQCRSTSDIYSNIVLPLCPNTGKIIPDHNITNRKRKADS